MEVDPAEDDDPWVAEVPPVLAEPPALVPVEVASAVIVTGPVPVPSELVDPMAGSDPPELPAVVESSAEVPQALIEIPAANIQA